MFVVEFLKTISEYYYYPLQCEVTEFTVKDVHPIVVSSESTTNC